MNKEQNSSDAQTDRPPYDADRIRELRERLYARSVGGQTVPRHSIPAEDGIERDLRTSVPTPVAPAVAPPAPPVPPPAVSYEVSDMSTKSRAALRTKIVIGAAVFFLVALLVSAALLFFGGNTISGENITITTSGPLQVGGGEELPFRVTVANQNAVPIQSVTLIVEYPRGTQSVSEEGKDLTVERRSLETIGAGEIVNVELGGRVYGEENEEQEIRVRVEYRIDGSNATFEKRADPLRFKIGTSPVVLTFDTVEAVSSGQEIEMKLTVQSNAPAPITDLLVKIAYPSGFDFGDASPGAISGENTWKIARIEPGEKKEITVRGILTGHETEVRQFTATAGVAGDNGSYELSSQLAASRTDVAVEKAFLNLGVRINGNTEDTVVIGKDETATIDIDFTNSLDAAIYDGDVIATLDGNALGKFNINPQGGFYDSSNNTIRWIGAEEDSLKEIVPGETSSLRFTISPKNNTSSGLEFKLSVAAKGNRIFESRPTEEIKGTAERTIRIESIPELGGDVYHSTGPFTNSGPTPPVAETTTQYTLTLRATAGANDMTGAEVTTTLPQYVNWLDLVTVGDVVSYNTETRVLKWTIGDLDAGETEDMSMQISFKPSTSQIGRTPTLLDTQRLKATDRFTGTVIRAESSALTTRISNVDGEDDSEGKVQKP